MLSEREKSQSVQSGAGPQSADLHKPSNSAGKERVHVFSSGCTDCCLIGMLRWTLARAKRPKTI